MTTKEFDTDYDPFLCDDCKNLGFCKKAYYKVACSETLCTEEYNDGESLFTNLKDTSVQINLVLPVNEQN